MAERDELLLKIALLYYEEEVTQSKIAEMLNLSRPTVASMLKEARQKGIVKISIQHSEHDLLKKQESIRKKYGLSNLQIASLAHSNQNDIKAVAGKLCAQLVEPLLPEIKNLGLGWGTTIFQYVEQASYRNLPELKIIPLVGGVGLSNVKLHSNHLAFVLSQKYNCDIAYFYAPAIAESLEVKEMLTETKMVKEVMEAGKKVDLAILGIGNPIYSSTYNQLGYIHNQDTDMLTEKKAIGDIGGTFFDKDGQRVTTDLSQRMIGIALEDLKHLKKVVIVATGSEKAESIETLLKMGFITDLIIDESIADYLDQN